MEWMAAVDDPGTCSASNARLNRSRSVVNVRVKERNVSCTAKTMRSCFNVHDAQYRAENYLTLIMDVFCKYKAW